MTILASTAAGWTSSGSSNRELVNNLRRDGRIVSARVAGALEAVDRADFVPATVRKFAYEDRPLPIGHDVTISAPHMHATALEVLEERLLEGGTVLDVGVGSGFLAAAMAHMVGPTGRVYGVDRLQALVDMAATNLRGHSGGALLDSGRVNISLADGWKGSPGAPFDAIHVGAAAARVPEALLQQLRPGGRMVVPVGPEGGAQELMQIDKAADGTVTKRSLFGVRYVPLVSQP